MTDHARHLADLQAALAQTSEQRLAAVLAARADGETHQAIGDALGITEAAVRLMIARAQKADQ